MPTSSESEHTLTVSAAESGQKLLQYLVRRLSLSQSMLHRWIRTGQIRVNGGRGKPFLRINAGDQIRLPPFALKMANSAQFQPNFEKKNPSSESKNAKSDTVAVPFLRYGRFGKRATIPNDLSLPPELGRYGDIWAYNKPAGLPVQPGTGHADSFVTRLAAAFSDQDFLPTPAHRLDMDTSGVLLVGASYTALRFLQDALRQHNIVKEYLTWVEGEWPHNDPYPLHHQLSKKYTGFFERMEAGTGKDSLCIVAPVLRTAHQSLLHIRLITGRTHQIRTQLSAYGHALVGDSKYGNSRNDTFLLHACRIIISAEFLSCFSKMPTKDLVFEALPPWQKTLSVATLPPPLTDASCQRIIANFQ